MNKNKTEGIVQLSQNITLPNDVLLNEYQINHIYQQKKAQWKNQLLCADFLQK